ncbi:TolB-like translocation protein [Paenibacillus lacisoli]|nr:hypothetical protein [Paenibacillus sp. JX-17]
MKKNSTALKRVRATTVCGLLLLSATACAAGTPDGRKTTTVGDGVRLTVLGPSVSRSAAYQRIDQITKLDGQTGLNWLSNQAVITSTVKITSAAPEKGSTTAPVVTSDITSVLRLDTGSTSDWEPGSSVQWISPDQKHAFVTVFNKDKYDASGYMLDLGSGKSVEIALEPGIIKGDWASRDSFTLADGSGSLLSIRTEGTVTPIPAKAAESGILDLRQRDRSLYTLDGDGHLTLMPVNTPLQTTRLSQARVTDFDISRDNRYAAIIENMSPSGADTSQEVLRLIDLHKPDEGVVIARGTLVECPAWSPDGSKLAFSIYTAGSGGLNGTYFMDLSSSQVVPVNDLAPPVYPVRWSPSSDRLMLTVNSSRKDQDSTTTYIYTFSQ